MTRLTETNSTGATRTIRNDLHDSGDKNLSALAHNLTDDQLLRLRKLVRSGAGDAIRAA